MTSRENQISGLCKLGLYLRNFLDQDPDQYDEEQQAFSQILKRSEIENQWFTPDNLRFTVKQWAHLLTEESVHAWLQAYRVSSTPKKVGLVLAGNIPMVGFHDVISVVLSGHIPVIKLSSKDQRLIPFLLQKWQGFSGKDVRFSLVQKLEGFDAVIATGSNNTARYLEYYFKDSPSIIRKNRTSVAVLSGKESDEELQLLAQDIFLYFGLGCRNVTRLFIPKDFALDRLFENFIAFKDMINHHKYANNYDYNRAVYLLNQEKFWDNNFVLMKEDESLFSPLAVLHFSRYETINEVKDFLNQNAADVQCVVALPDLGFSDAVAFGEAQNPALNTYADNVDTMRFLEVI